MTATLADFMEQLITDMPKRRAYAADPGSVLAASGLTQEEQEALTTGDVHAIRTLLCKDGPHYDMHAKLTVVLVMIRSDSHDD
jgi:hypothetical protein